MSRAYYLSAFVTALLFLNACTGQRMAAPVVESSESEPAVLVEETEAVDLGYSTGGVQTQPLDDEEFTAVELTDETQSSTSLEVVEEDIAPPNPAVIALLNSADAQTRAGDHARAAATLERAVQIEPKNAGVWHRLAKVRFKQGMYQQAANLATRSNSLAGNDRDLRADNWLLIARARRALGDDAGAEEAEQRAQQFLKLTS